MRPTTEERTHEAGAFRLVIGQFMTWPAVTVAPDATVTQAIDVMDHGKFDHLLISYREWLGGTLCRSDLAEAAPHAIAWQFAEEVAMLSPRLLVIDVLRRMSAPLACCLPVAAPHGMWGIVTLSDLLVAPSIEALIPRCDSCRHHYGAEPPGRHLSS